MIAVLHGLRLEDPTLPEHDGRPSASQIDHLLIHRHGVFIVESKSVSEAVTVRPDSSGGDEWTREIKGKVQGMPSPIQQGVRQGDLLRRILNEHHAVLRDKATGIAGVLQKTLTGTTQRGFARMPIQIIVAISDGGMIRRLNGWKPPTAPYETFVCKADQVCDKVQSEIRRHTEGSRLLSKPESDYGMWAMSDEELTRTARFLAERHTPLKIRTRIQDPPPPPKPAAPSPTTARTAWATAESRDGIACCRFCGGTDLAANWGRYGYYWRCSSCDKSTTMPVVCSICGTQGARGEGVKIRKEGPKYFRACSQCGIEECIWTQPG
jgi:hypothetical protein